ncbi:metallophosphoesterase family protein [Saxibacter everestensis]|uniref:Metallophosphoesterase family protein n=1 Tax=Saxibacter everestensis TaxID=2909229 RepID=A0ABY8QRZ0_9MICO|nr:metallophosphoesterase family protein [Brevibacteriaceae bacterium ZFBP1038]
MQLPGPDFFKRERIAAWLRPRRIATITVTLLVLALIVAPWAVTSAKVTENFGPHDASYSLTTDGLFTVDLGPLGSIEMPMKQIPAPLGVRIDVQEIPAGLSAVGKPNTIDDLGRDVDSYATFFNSPQTQIDAVTRALTMNILLRLVVGTVLLAAVIIAIRAALGRSRRAELVGYFRSRPVLFAGSATVLASALLIGMAVAAPTRPESFEADPLFDGTPLAGARVTGRLSSVVDQVGGLVADYYKENESFYSDALKNLNLVLGAESGTSGRLALPDGVSIVDPDAPEGPSSSASASAEARASESAKPDPSESEAEPSLEGSQPLQIDPAKVVTFLVVSDVHCNVGMSRVIGKVAEARRVDAVIDAGDVTMTGTPAEAYCVDSMTSALPKGVDKVFVKGNHDSAETVAQEADEGVTVLDGEPVEVQGIRILGDDDPRRTVFGEGSKPTGKETVGTLSRRLADTACDSRESIDLLLIHDPVAGADTLDRGCAPLQISGHWHRRLGPEQYGQGIRYVNSTTGGALANALTPGPLRMNAEMTLFRFDSETGRAVDYQIVTVTPDREVTVGQWTPMPIPKPSAAEVEGAMPESGSPEGGG